MYTETYLSFSGGNPVFWTSSNVCFLTALSTHAAWKSTGPPRAVRLPWRGLKQHAVITSRHCHTAMLSPIVPESCKMVSESCSWRRSESCMAHPRRLNHRRMNLRAGATLPSTNTVPTLKSRPRLMSPLVATHTRGDPARAAASSVHGSRNHTASRSCHNTGCR